MAQGGWGIVHMGRNRWQAESLNQNVFARDAVAEGIGNCGDVVVRVGVDLASASVTLTDVSQRGQTLCSVPLRAWNRRLL